jgi:cytochrome b561
MTFELTSSARYTTVAVVLHWMIAILILGMIPIGWWMSDAVMDPATRGKAGQAFQLHKSVGLTILALSLVRLVWRLMHKAPPLPQGMATWETSAAKATHWVFYFLMIALPVSGWIYTSAGYSVSFERFFPVATSWFGLFEVPHIPPVATQDEATRKLIGESAMNAHSKMAWGVLILAGLHVAAALKHHLFNKDDVLTRMLPFLRPLRKTG